MSTPAALAATLTSAPQVEWVRFVADWLTGAESLEQVPGLTGSPVIDALVAAAAAHKALTVAGGDGRAIPAWTDDPARRLDALWYPGLDALFPNALVHSPLAFRMHGVLVEADSLRSV